MEKVVVVADVHRECSLPQSSSSDMEEVVVVADVYKEYLQPQFTNSVMEEVVVADVHTECLQPQSTNSEMEEVVVVATDVNQNANLPSSDPTCAEMEKQTGQDTMEAARKIKESQGDHETEVSCGGEDDLRKHMTGCPKNPGHEHFVPVKSFEMKHLPSDYRKRVMFEKFLPYGYRNRVIFNWIRAEADLTCRLLMRYTSKGRPKFHPGRQSTVYPFYQDDKPKPNSTRYGTGWVAYVNKYTKKDNKECQCDECTRPGSHTPKKIWGEVVICTACHVVFDDDEARHTTCTFFYDTSTTDVNTCPTLTGLKVVYSDIKGDMCRMTCVTHDMDLVDKLVKMCDLRLKIFEDMRDVYWDPRSSDSNCNRFLFHLFRPTIWYRSTPVVVISHPHGCPKHITVGEGTHRQTHGENQKYEDITGLKAEYVRSSYEYKAATCPGSSGAPVIRLPNKIREDCWSLLYSHPHSTGNQNNDNSSGCTEEFVSFPPIPDDKLTKLGFTVIVLSSVLAFILSVDLAVVDTVKGEAYSKWICPCIVLIYVLCYWCNLPFRRRAALLFHMLVIWSFVLASVLALVLRLVDNSDIDFISKIFSWVIGVIWGFIMFLYFTNRLTSPLKSTTTQRRLRQQPLKRTTATTIPHTPTTALTTPPPTTALTTPPTTTAITITPTESTPLLQPSH